MIPGKRLIIPAAVILTLGAAMTARTPLSEPDTTPITPQIPNADRNMPGRVFLEQADSMMVDPSEPDVQIVIGNVCFRRGGMFMYCDRARFYTSPSLPADSMEAFGNIYMEQGDTLFLYGDTMTYSGIEELATIWGAGSNQVRLINRDVTLTAPVLNYSMAMELGFYEEGGTLTDPQNRLTSWAGEYAPSTKEATFMDDVVLDGISNNGDSIWVYTDNLLYNTDTRIAELNVPSRIVGKDGIIFTSKGFFDTGRNISTLLDRSTVHTQRGNDLTGDSLIFDRTLGIGEAFGNMVLTDSARQVTIDGDYGFFNELTDSAYCTGHTRLREYSQTDTLYMHGDVIRTYILNDSTRLTISNPNVRFWRTDLQGVCDSMTFVSTDSTLRMDYDPVVWSGNRQIFGNRIIVHMNDSTVEKAELPDFGFMAEMVEEPYFNQLSGKEMIAYFKDGDLRQLDVNGSVQAIMLPQENDSTYNKIANIESSFLSALFNKRELQRAKLWDESSGTVTPLYLAKRSLLRLPKFQWREAIRPTGPDDIWPLITLTADTVPTDTFTHKSAFEPTQPQD